MGYSLVFSCKLNFLDSKGLELIFSSFGGTDFVSPSSLNPFVVTPSRSFNLRWFGVFESFHVVGVFFIVSGVAKFLFPLTWVLVRLSCCSPNFKEEF